MRNTKAVVSLGAIRHNVRELKKLVDGAGLMAVVKANGYGHGANEVARAASSAGASYLCVATLEEGISLRAAGIDSPVLVMGVLSEADCAQCVYSDLSACVFLPTQVAAMQQAAIDSGKQAQAHLKIDSGFHRIGVYGQALDEMLLAFLSNDHVMMEGIFTHFATADMNDDSFVVEQLERFEEALAKVRAFCFHPLVHVSNSAAMMRRGKLCGDMVRMGIAMYGCLPSGEMPLPFKLMPALKWVSEIGAINRLSIGETVGYGRMFKAQRESVIATLPLGYADGYARRFGGCAAVLIHGKRCPVIGRVCMDQTMVDITDIQNPKLRDEVVLLGEQGSERITANDLAKWMGSIDYEVLTGISQRVPREYRDE